MGRHRRRRKRRGSPAGASLRGGLLCLAKAAAPVLATVWLFFDWEPISWILLLAVPVLVRRERRRQREEELWRMNLAFKDVLVYLQNGLAAGESPESSLAETKRALALLYGGEHPMVVQLGRVLAKMSTGSRMEQAFAEFARESGIEDIEQFSELFSVVKRTGGSLIRVLRQTGGILQDKIELKRELRTAVAAKRMEFRVMCVIPYAILLYVKLCAPQMTQALYHSVFGVAFMSVLLLCYLGLCVLGGRLAEERI